MREASLLVSEEDPIALVRFLHGLEKNMTFG